jgi:hypothetical protein
VAEEADARAAQVWQTSSGDAVDAFQEWWTREDGPSRRLAEDAAAALIGGALMAFAAITLALKINFIVQLIILAVEVAQAIATAVVTFGATTAEVPGFIALTRFVCRELVQQVITHITTVIKDIFERAAQLLKKAETKFASRAERRAAEHLAEDAVKDAAHGAPDIPAPMTLKRFEGKSMIDEYRYETDPRHPLSAFPGGKGVRRLNPAEQENHRLFFGEDGLLRKASDGSVFDTAAAATEHNGAGRAIFVMDEQGNIFASTYQKVGEFHHSTLANGQPVAAAGEIQVAEGRVQEVTAASGHYRPGPDHMRQVSGELARNGAADVPVYDFTGSSRWF